MWGGGEVKKARQRRHIPGVAEAREPRRLASRERESARARERESLISNLEPRHGEPGPTDVVVSQRGRHNFSVESVTAALLLIDK